MIRSIGFEVSGPVRFVVSDCSDKGWPQHSHFALDCSRRIDQHVVCGAVKWHGTPSQRGPASNQGSAFISVSAQLSPGVNSRPALIQDRRLFQRGFYFREYGICFGRCCRGRWRSCARHSIINYVDDTESSSALASVVELSGAVK